MGFQGQGGRNPLRQVKSKMDDHVVPFDLVRMFLGDDPPLFYLEIVFRCCVIYAYTLVMIRWIGGRGIAQMSVVEFLLVIALGSAVGDALFYPEVPLFHALLVITMVILINKGLDAMIFKSTRVERAMDGMALEVVRDGVINVRVLQRLNLGQNELFEALREKGFRSLGEVEAAYLETSGNFSAFKRKAEVPGLPIEPPWDVAPPETLTPGSTFRGRAACRRCGYVLPEGQTITPDKCAKCDHREWTPARWPDASDADG